MFCERCGSEIEEGDVFCGKCGSKTGSSSSKTAGKGKKKLNDELMINTLSQYCSEEDPLKHYVYGYCNPSVAANMLLGAFAVLDRKNFFVGVTNSKVILVCIDLKLNEKTHSILPFHQMESIDISKRFLVKRMKITMPDKSNIAINVTSSVRGVKKQKENMNRICEMFELKHVMNS